MKFENLFNDGDLQDYENSLLSIINSISKEEAAIARLIESEAQKMEAFVNNFEESPTNKEIIEFSFSEQRLMDNIFIKEWLLLRKFEAILHQRQTKEIKCDICLKEHCTCVMVDDEFFMEE